MRRLEILRRGALLVALAASACTTDGLVTGASDGPDGGANLDTSRDVDVQFGTRVHVLPTRDHLTTHLSTALSAQLRYFGGKVIPNAKVFSINWGPNVSSTIATGMPKFYAAVTGSAHFDWLSEYDTVGLSGQDGQPGSNQRIGRGTLGGSITITPSVTGTTVSDAQIQAELAAQIAAGKLPSPDDDSYYAINFPKGITITQGGSQSCVAFCAYHGTFVRGGQDVYYGVLPSLEAGTGCDTGCGNNGDVFKNSTSAASHELVEAVTDAEVGIGTTVGRPLAWYDSSQGEIGDICAATDGTIVGADGVTYTLQSEYDNATHSCVVTKAVAGNDFALALASPSLTVAPGASTSTSVTTAVTAGSAQAITLAVAGLPSGVTGSFSPATVTAGGAATLTLVASSGAAAGSASFTVTGTGSISHSASGTVTVTGSGGGGSVLQNDVALGNLAGALASDTLFTMVVPAGASGLSFTLSGGTGDADLYVRFASAPTLSTFDCRPFLNGNNESCAIASAQAGTYFVMLHGFAAYAGASLVGHFTTGGGGGGGLQSGVGVAVSGATGSRQSFGFTVAGGTGNVVVRTTGGTGNLTLYVKVGGAATTTSFTCRSATPASNGETCTVPRQNGTYGVLLRGTAAYAGATLTATF